jgi:hypothetical protein
VNQSYPKNGDDGSGWRLERTPTQVPLWWVLMVSTVLAALAVSAVLLIRVYGPSLRTTPMSLALPWRSADSSPPLPRPTAAGSAAHVGNDVPPSDAPRDEMGFPAGPIPGLTYDRVRATFEQRGFRCDPGSPQSSQPTLGCTIPDSRLYTQAGAMGQEPGQVWLVSCQINYAYVETPPSQQEMLQCFDAVAAATASGAELDGEKAWIREHIADRAIVSTRVGSATVVLDPRKAVLEVQGGL